jgi:hypothetical protein
VPRDRVNYLLLPECYDRQGGQEFVIFRRQEQAVSQGSRAAACSTHPLEKGGDRRGSTNLNHAVEIADIETKFQCRRCDDDAVRFIDEGGFRLPPFVERQGRYESAGRPAR